MKQLGLLLVFLTLVLIAQSQSLVSKDTSLTIKQIKKSTCYTEGENIKILELQINSRYNDSIATMATNQVAELQNLVVTKDHMITTQKNINEDYRLQLANKDEIEVNFQKEIVIHKRTITRLKTQRFFIIAIATVIAGIAIAK